jgi:hypothetical protein
MNQVRSRLPAGKVVVLLLLGLAILILAADGVLHPERRYLSLVFVLLGTLGSYRLYLKWRGE